MSLKDRLRLIRGGRTQEEFGRIFGFNPGTYAKFEKSGKTIDPAFLITLSKEEGVDLNWLITGESEKACPEQSQRVEGQSTTNPRIPIVGEVAAGIPTIIYSDIQESADASETIDEWFYHCIKYNHSNQVVFVRVSGDSMEPQFLDQDLLLIERNVPFNCLKRGVFGIFSVDGEFTFKRLNIQSSDLILLEPLNSKYSTIAAKPSLLHIYGIAIALFRSLKEGMLCL